MSHSMKEFFTSSLLGDIAKALAADIAKVPEASLFPCRPIAAATAGGRSVLGRFRGTIALGNCKEFEEALAELVKNHPHKVILDMAEVALSKTAMGILVNFAADGHGRNNRMYIFRPSEQIMLILGELDLHSFFSFLETEEDVMAALLI